jgi:exportin-7
MFLNMRKEKHSMQMIRSHVMSEPGMLNQLMSTLFNYLLFSSHANHWAVTRPILSLMLASEDSFNAYRDQLISSQAPENKIKLREEFEKLTADIQRSVDTVNRDKFTQRLTLFRINVRQFLTL